MKMKTCPGGRLAASACTTTLYAKPNPSAPLTPLYPKLVERTGGAFTYLQTGVPPCILNWWRELAERSPTSKLEYPPVS
jgi:hypothetical protein